MCSKSDEFGTPSGMDQRLLLMRIDCSRLLWELVPGDFLCKDPSPRGVRFVVAVFLSSDAAKSEGTLFGTKISSGDEAFSDLRR